MKVSLQTDSDGFLSQECPACAKHFKVVFGEGSSEPISHCAYCGHEGHDCWWTPKQADYLSALAANQIAGPQWRKMATEFTRSTAGLLDVRMDVKVPPVPHKPIERDDEWPITEFHCCSERIKHDGTHNELHRVICGQQKDVIMTTPGKIFLSHKGIDKPKVREYKQTLEQLGFEPWLDEDAMTAGIELERGLLNGFKESCAAVFFVTPAFEDDNYLATEVNYAIAEKRVKKESFAIIAIRFEDGSGGEASIPELLRPYVWKEPKTDLEALREILRALPIQVGPVDWKTSDGQSNSQAAERQSAAAAMQELSTEAKRLLTLATADTRGRVMMSMTMHGFSLSTNGTEIVEHVNGRDEAVWRGAVDELIRRGFLEDRGHKGEVFAVTRAGFDYADELRFSGLDEDDRTIFQMNEEERCDLMTRSRPRNRQAVPLDFFDQFPSRETAKYPDMLDKYVELNLMRIGSSGYMMTQRGFDITDKLWRVFILRAIESNQDGEWGYVETETIATAVVLTDGNDESTELQRHLKALSEEGLIEIVPSDGGIVAARMTSEGKAYLRPYA